jgi:RNA polymerase sigma-70 factor (ECF subfamily)
MNASSPTLLLAAYLRRRGELVGYFQVRLGSREAAEDLVQDLFVRIARLPAAAIDHPDAFLFRVGANLMLDRMKHARRARKHDAAWQGAHATIRGGEALDGEVAADDALDARQRLQRIIEVVRDLPPPLREAFRLHKLEGLSHAETARAMNLSRSSIEKYISTCLRRILAAQAPAFPD